MYIQNIRGDKGSQETFIIDINKLLNKEETLNFSFEDFNESFSTIMVQTKDLSIYQIDFTNNQVL